jgi:hypothetical protein
MGRPTKFSAQTRRDSLEAFSWGASIRDAAAYAGVDHKTLLRWLKDGEAQESGAKADFFREVEAARASPRLRALKKVWSEVPNDTGAAKWFLERRDPSFAPPQPNPPAVLPAPITINLALADGALPALMGPALDVIEGEVVDEQDDEPAG